jgi:FMN-dependent NADH-azoreductase
MNLLHIDSSILGIRSVSRALSAQIVEREKTIHPELTVLYRDLTSDAALHLSAAHIVAWADEAPEDDALAGAALCSDLELSEDYLAELFEADIIVIGAPMYNFTVPSQLKAWIDRVVVAGESFRYNESGESQTLLPAGKKVIIASTRGNAYHPELPTAALEHHESYLKGVLSFVGLHDVTVIRAEGLAFGTDVRNAAIRKAQARIAEIVA